MSKDNNVMSVVLLSEIQRISDSVLSLCEQCHDLYEKAETPTTDDELEGSVSAAIRKIVTSSTKLRRTAILLASQSFTSAGLVADGANE